MAAAYPDRWEADVVLADGGTAHLRPITPADGDLLRQFTDRVSPESIYYRFFAPHPKLSDRDVAHFTGVDYVDRVALVALIGGEMVAVVRYDRVDDTEAEVAFLVEDAHHGRGLASVLLEHLAAAAAERGIGTFVADVLPANRRMIGVLTDAGYTASRRLDEGVVRLTLDLAPTQQFQDVVAAREHRAEARSIERLAAPSSVAVIGAGADPRGAGHTVLRHLLHGGFAGPVYPVNRARGSVAAVRAYRTVMDVPDPVDLAVIAVPAAHVEEVVEQCAAKGVHAVVVISAGFAELGDAGRQRQSALVRLARAGGMRVVGPNCLGVANTDPAVALNATLAPVVPGRGPIGFFSQSGALGIALLTYVAERGIGISTFVSAGNRADVSGNDLLQYWDEDPATDVIALYLESIGNPRKFSRLCRRIARRKPIVAVRSGGTTQGVPLGHAVRALDLPDHAVSALFRQAGVVRVDDLGQLFDVAQLAGYQPTPAGGRVGIVGNSDALTLLATDACVRFGLDPAPPVDLAPQAGAGELETALRDLAADDAIDSIVAVFVPPVGVEIGPGAPGETGPRFTGTVDVAAALRRVAAAAGKPIVTTYLGRRGMPAELRAGTADGATPGAGSLPSYPTPEAAVRALAYVTDYARWRATRTGPPRRPARVVAAEARALLDAARTTATDTGERSRLLAAYGIDVWPMVPVAGADEAVRAADAAGYPVVLKVRGSRARGRADVSDLRVGLTDERSVRAACAELVAEFGDRYPLVVQRMAPSGVPVSIQAGEDPSFGPVVSFGVSYPTTELLGDRGYRLAPLGDTDADELVHSIRAAPLLTGYRGAEPADLDALRDLLQRVAQLVDDLPEVTRLTLDPVLAGPQGATVLDADAEFGTPRRPDVGPRRLR